MILSAFLGCLVRETRAHECPRSGGKLGSREAAQPSALSCRNESWGPPTAAVLNRAPVICFFPIEQDSPPSSGSDTAFYLDNFF